MALFPAEIALALARRVEGRCVGWCLETRAYGVRNPLSQWIVRGSFCRPASVTANTTMHIGSRDDRGAHSHSGVKAIHKLIDAYPDPIAVTDVEDY